MAQIMKFYKLFSQKSDQRVLLSTLCQKRTKHCKCSFFINASRIPPTSYILVRQFLPFRFRNLVSLWCERKQVCLVLQQTAEELTSCSLCDDFKHILLRWWTHLTHFDVISDLLFYMQDVFGIFL